MIKFRLPKVTVRFIGGPAQSFAECTHAADPPAEPTCPVCKGTGVYDTGAPGSTPYAPCYYCGGDGKAPQDLSPALEQSIARVRNEKAVAEYNATCNANAPPMPNPERSTPEHASEASGRARGKW
jgi:hypothetical protein